MTEGDLSDDFIKLIIGWVLVAVFIGLEVAQTTLSPGYLAVSVVGQLGALVLAIVVLYSVVRVNFTKLMVGWIVLAVALWIEMVNTALPTRYFLVAFIGKLGVAILGVAVLYSAVRVHRESNSSKVKGGENREGHLQSDDSTTRWPTPRLPEWRRISRRRLLEIVALIPATLLSLLGVMTAVATIVYPREYVWRALAWGESDVGDYLKHFPQRPLTASPSSYRFEMALDERRVSDAFESVLDVDDFETFLTETETQAFIVIKDDRIVYESYFNGWRRESMVTSFSVAKSFVSTLVGIAIQEGFIEGLDDPITRYLPELLDRDPRFANITIRHLLTMSSGLAYREERWGLYNGDDTLTTYHPDQRFISLHNTRMVDPPGEYFQYNKYHPQLLGMILERTTGVSVTEWTQSRLWDPLGMEFDGAWSLDSNDSGFERMEAGLNARPIDFAKLGSLFLRGGTWNGERIVPGDWVALATGSNPSGRVPTFSNDAYYAFMWWGFTRENEPPDYTALGDHGQYVYVSPTHGLVIVRNGVEFGIESKRWTEAFYRVASKIA